MRFIGVSRGVDKYNNDVNKHNIECNSNNSNDNNRIKEKREKKIWNIGY